MNIMSFKYGVLTAREMEIAGYLKEKQSLKQIEQRTGLSKKILEAHLRNMIQKLKANDLEGLIKRIQTMIH